MKWFKSFFLPFNLPPLFHCALLFMCGILSATYINSFLIFIVICLSLNAALFLLYRTKVIDSLLTCILSVTFLLGYLRYQQQIHTYQFFHKTYGNVPCDIRTIVINKKDIEHPIMKLCTTLQITSIKNSSSEWESENNCIQIYTKNNINLEISDEIELNGMRIKQPGSQSFRDYLIKEGIVGTLFQDKFEYKLINRPLYSLYRWIFNQKQRLFQNLQQKFSSQTFTFFSSLFLGNRTINKKELERASDLFKQWGIAHYLARSGLHLVIFVVIWYNILRLIPFSFAIKHLIILLFSFIYFILSWPTTSFIRAFYAFLFCQLCILLKTRSHFLHTLTLVACIILFLNPIQLFFLDFQLSFALTFALVWFNHIYHANTLIEKQNY